LDIFELRNDALEAFGLSLEQLVLSDYFLGVGLVIPEFRAAHSLLKRLALS
jgi:hypothetical protein